MCPEPRPAARWAAGELALKRCGSRARRPAGRAARKARCPGPEIQERNRLLDALRWQGHFLLLKTLTYLTHQPISSSRDISGRPSTGGCGSRSALRSASLSGVFQSAATVRGCAGGSGGSHSNFNWRDTLLCYSCRRTPDYSRAVDQFSSLVIGEGYAVLTFFYAALRANARSRSSEHLEHSGSCFRISLCRLTQPRRSVTRIVGMN